jgi:hypothetical protein
MAILWQRKLFSVYETAQSGRGVLAAVLDGGGSPGRRVAEVESRTSVSPLSVEAAAAVVPILGGTIKRCAASRGLDRGGQAAMDTNRHEQFFYFFLPKRNENKAEVFFF